MNGERADALDAGLVRVAGDREPVQSGAAVHCGKVREDIREDNVRSISVHKNSVGEACHIAAVLSWVRTTFTPSTCVNKCVAYNVESGHGLSRKLSGVRERRAQDSNMATAPTHSVPARTAVNVDVLYKSILFFRGPPITEHTQT